VSSWGALESAIERLREIDAKGILAYVLTFAAGIDLAESRVEPARARAREALHAAEIVNRRTRIVLARTVLGKAEIAEGNASAARLQLEAMQGDLVLPLGVSARARAAAFDLASMLDKPVHQHAHPRGSP
jgi:ATP/maltotriose-dependent transcriptional regulator MalT